MSQTAYVHDIIFICMYIYTPRMYGNPVLPCTQRGANLLPFPLSFGSLGVLGAWLWLASSGLRRNSHKDSRLQDRSRSCGQAGRRKRSRELSIIPWSSTLWGVKGRGNQRRLAVPPDGCAPSNRQQNGEHPVGESD